MKTSRAWFQKNASQNMNANLSRLPTMALSNYGGANTKSNNNKAKDGNTAFVVGKSTVGGEEVIG